MTRFSFVVLGSVLGGSVFGLGCAPRQPDPAPKTASAATPTSGGIVGRPPPPFSVAKWIKGEPVTGFEKGKVYVVDFWATWCGPCKAAIPHLTELARKEKGRIEVIGVSIIEKQSGPSDAAYIEGVEKFVEKMGDRMDYRVAVDTPDKRMYTTWFKPTGIPGIPTAYIIDKNGQVAWVGIGDPKDVERIAGEVFNGTFDAAKEAEARRTAEKEADERSKRDIEAAKANSGSRDERYPGYQAAMERGDRAAALASLNAAFKADPSSEASGAYQWKLMLLLQSKDPVPAVNAYSKDLMERYGDNDDIVGFVSAVIVATSEDEARFDAKLAFEAARKTAERAKPNSRWQQFACWRLGWAYYHTGNREKAKESVQSALDSIAKLKSTIDFDNLESECTDAIRVFGKNGG